MKKNPPISLGSQIYRYRYGVGLLLVLVLSAYFRFFHLATLPPGLSNTEASTATNALSIITKTPSISQLFHQGIGHGVYLFVVAISVKLLGANSYALRLPSAILGLAGVVMTYFWVKSWFSTKVALTASILMAVTPWTVGLSRIAVANSALILVVPTVLLLITLAVRHRHPALIVTTGLALGLCTTGAAGIWLLVGLFLSLVPSWRKMLSKDKDTLRTGLTISALASLIGIPLAILRFSNFHIPVINADTLGTVISRASITLGMFNIKGDTDFAYNIAGAPLLNLFISLMFLVGILVCFIRLHQSRYRMLIILLTTLLIPVMAQTNAPSSLTALILAPVALALAANGISYMLEVWYSTFPINSAARTLGTVPIVLLLTISAYQGYKQYFVAWARSPETYTAYNEPATALAGYLNRTNFSGTRYVLSQDRDIEIINFLTTGKARYTSISPQQISTLPQPKQPQQIIFVTPQPTDIIPELKARFPKAQLSQHFSDFNDSNQLFAVYQTKP